MFQLEMKKYLILLFIFSYGCSDMGTNPKEEINTEEMSYKKHIQPFFNANCVNCHGNNGNLSLTTYNNLMKGGNSGKSIIANNSTGSLLINRLSGVGPGQRMPPEPASQLDDMKIELVNKWIDQGALNN